MPIVHRNSSRAKLRPDHPSGWRRPCSPLRTSPIDAHQELAQFLSLRVHRYLAIAILGGARSIPEGELIQLLRLQRKRPTVARQVVSLVMSSLRSTGVLPLGFAVTR